MISFLFAIALNAIGPAPHRPPVAALSRPLRRAAADAPTPDIGQTLMTKFHAMEDAKQGVFHDEVTPLVAAYFPPGQTFAETQAILEQQHLGTLKPFKGTLDPSEGKMYVTTFSLMLKMFSDVYVVLDFDFDGTTQPDMVLRRMRAFLSANNM